MSQISTKTYNVYYLEMHQNRLQIQDDDVLFSLEEITKPISSEDYIRLYKGVGDAYQWTDRLVISKTDLHSLINKDSTHVYTLKANGIDVGFTELICDTQFVELQYFGLFTNEIGKGYGPALLKKTIQQAWSFSPKWIQLNTCDLDHPKALALYKSLGFKEIRRDKRIE